MLKKRYKKMYKTKTEKYTNMLPGNRICKKKNHNNESD